MKGSAAFIAGTVALAASAVRANVIEARASASSSVAASATSSGSLPTITTKGNAFWSGSERFFIRGVDYQPGGSSGSAGSSGVSDPLADTAGCTRDIAEFKKLGINTIRVYTVDNTADHDTCMGLLADAGIYLAVDVNTPLYSLNREDPAPSYNAEYLQSVFATVDAFAKYTNTLLFYSGNEVINSDNTTDCAPYVKAVTRDIKQYRDSRGYRSIPVGYSAADVDSNRYEMAEYMNCGTEDQRSDFFAFNDYSWCDPSSFTTSGWSAKVELFSNYSIPLFLSEYGCITNTRTFEEVSSLYSTSMTAVYSGGLVYEYSEEGSGYGLVTIDGTSVTETTGFTDLASQLAANPAPTGSANYLANGVAATCPSTSSTWEVTAFTGDELPAIPSGAVKYMSSGAGTGPGLTGSGSQDAGGASSGTATAGSGVATSTASSSTTATGSSTKAATTSTGAASSMVIPDMGFAPFAMTAVVFLSTVLGATLL